MKKTIIGILFVALSIIAFSFWRYKTSIPPSNTEQIVTDLTVAIAPYQDIAMLVNAHPLGFDAKHGLNLHLVTLAWEDILPAVGSAGKTVDVGFGSLTEYLTKYSKLNSDSNDPILFVQPLYVYNGGGFVTLRPDIPLLNAQSLNDPSLVAAFLHHKIGAQKQSLYEMMLFTLARRAKVPPTSLTVFDSPLNDGLLALQNGSLDLTAAGLTQVNQAVKLGGHVVLSMHDSGFADVTGFIVRKSVLESKRTAIENLTRTWFDCVSFVMRDLPNNSTNSLSYLQKNAATQYTFSEYASALSQEYLPSSLAELQANVLNPKSEFDFTRISSEIIDYLLENKIINVSPPIPDVLLNK